MKWFKKKIKHVVIIEHSYELYESELNKGTLIKYGNISDVSLIHNYFDCFTFSMNISSISYEKIMRDSLSKFCHDLKRYSLVLISLNEKGERVNRYGRLYIDQVNINNKRECYLTLKTR